MSISTIYDTVASAYAATYADEVSRKPMDREQLTSFAEMVWGKGPVADLGCGPGYTTAFLHRLGVAVTGYDLSHGQIREARRLQPNVPFDVADMLALPMSNQSLAGIIAFYAIVHFTPNELRSALSEMYRKLKPSGRLLITFHIGEEPVRIDNFLGGDAALDFQFFQPASVANEMKSIGFELIEVIERKPYPISNTRPGVRMC